MKKRFIFIPVLLFFAIAITSTILIFRINNRKKPIIAFYDVSEDIIACISEQIHNELPNVSIKILTETEVLDKKIEKKYDALITYNGSIIQNNLDKLQPINEKLNSNYGRSITNSPLYTKNKKLVVQPVLFDNFEFIVLQNTYTQYGLNLPESFSDIKRFARHTKNFFSIPIVISGKDDTTVNSLFSMMVESYGGKEAYYEMAKKLSATTDFSTIYDYKIGGDAPEELTIRNLLLEIKDWSINNLLDSQWYERTSQNTDTFIDDAVVAMSFMNLSEHRTKSLPNIKYYTYVETPSEFATQRTTIQPAIVSVYFKNSDTAKKIQEVLVQTENQEILSEQTKLASCILQGDTYDSLTNTARFIAYSTEGGPVPDLGTLSFQTKEKQHQLAQAIRDFCKK